jgi:hypothetical protein
MAEIEYASPEMHLGWTQPEDDAGKSLMNLSEFIDQDNDGRRSRAAYNASLLEGLGLAGFGAWAYGGRSTGHASVRVGTKESPLIWNYPAAALDTLQAKVVGQREDKPMVMVTDGDWDDERRAVWNTRMLEGLYKMPQGQYHTVWDLGRSAFKIAAGVTGTVAAKVFPYHDEGRIVCELHDTLDMGIDAFECSYTNPLTYTEQTWFDAHRLMAIFSDRKEKQLIWDAREPLPTNRGGSDGSQKSRYMVRLVEGWRMKTGKTDGVYCAAINTGTLDHKPWTHTSPPFAFLHARRSLAGFFGIPILERGMRIAERINQIVASLDNTERLLPKNLLIYDIKKTPKELMKNIADVMLVGFNSEMGGENPEYVTPPVYDQTIINLLEFHVRAFHETLGINSNQMSAQKQPGIVAAAAIRTVQDMFTELFSVAEKDYSHFLTSDLGSLHMRAIDDMVEEDPEFSVTWKGGSFFKKVKASSISMADKQFVFDVVPVNETRDTPADRISMADEMLARGQLSEVGYQQVVRTGDLPGADALPNAQHDLIAQNMDSWMFDEIEDIKNTSPLPWMNQGDSITQVMTGYIKALMRPKFDPARELYFRRWITQSDAMLKRQDAAKAALEGAASGGKQAPALLGVAQQPEQMPVAAE